jgi:hypothetical protein
MVLRFHPIASSSLLPPRSFGTFFLDNSERQSLLLWHLDFKACDYRQHRCGILLSLTRRRCSIERSERVLTRMGTGTILLTTISRALNLNCHWQRLLPTYIFLIWNIRLLPCLGWIGFPAIACHFNHLSGLQNG